METLIAPLPEVATFSKKYFILTKVYIYEGGIKYLFHGLFACAGDSPLAKARGLYRRTDLGITVTWFEKQIKPKTTNQQTLAGTVSDY